MAVKVTTNGHHRDVLGPESLTEAERKDFDYLDWPALERGEDSASFVRYRGDLIDLGDLQGAAPASLGSWHGYLSTSFFDGLVFRYVDDCQGVVVGHYVEVDE